MAKVFLGFYRAGLLGEIIIIFIISALIAAVWAYFKTSGGHDFGDVYKNAFKVSVVVMAIIDVIWFLFT